MNIPDTFTVGPLTYKVIYDPHLRTDKGESLFGQTLYSEQEIKLLPNLSPGQTGESFVHECLHTLDGYYKLGLGEETIGRLAPVLYETFERNGMLK